MMKTKSFILFTALFIGVIAAYGQNDMGCTVVNASNYDSEALFDDGSCCFQNWISIELSEPMNEVLVYSNWVSYYADPSGTVEHSFCAPSGGYSVYFSGGNLNSNATIDDGTSCANGNWADERIVRLFFTHRISRFNMSTNKYIPLVELSIPENPTQKGWTLIV